MSVVFKEGVLKDNQHLPIQQPSAKKYIESIVKNVACDKRFVYYLLASTGICVVPLSGFNSTLQGFRITILEKDDAKFEKVFETLAVSIEEYVTSK
jgi:aspartate/methionine/tyrosine aminotransferase